jgi:hypothetical protein
MTSKIVVAALAAALTQTTALPHAPVAVAGDAANLNYQITASTPPNGKLRETDASFALHADTATQATAVVTIAGKERTATLPLAHDGVLDVSNQSVSDLVPMYNAIPQLLDTTDENLRAKSASWTAKFPAKVSQTDWKDIPISVHSETTDGAQIMTLSGSHQDVVMAQGFTVTADVKVTGTAEFDNGKLRKAHFDVDEVLHAFKDIPLSYHLTISPRQV